ncbi:hypothetical protein [Granulicella mallensis]|uniref:hypothetical protein n=1 Tax=Granulicella mallensis TaxID=940614 RepID=UPI0012370A79|nr:hypothetical protein [Granulicella mallensis]
MKTNLGKDCQLIFCHLFVRQTFVFWEEILIEQKQYPLNTEESSVWCHSSEFNPLAAFADHSYSALTPAAFILSPYPCHGFFEIVCW